MNRHLWTDFYITKLPELGYSQCLTRLFESSGDQDVYCGEASIFLFPPSMRRHVGMVEAAAHVSDDVVEAVRAFHLEKDMHHTGTVAVIGRVHVEEAVRGRGRGTWFVEDVVDSLTDLQVDAVTVLPDLGNTVFRQKTEDMFAAAGFQTVDGRAPGVMKRVL
ncbi:hypothetical protein [Alkalicoccus chagannorensis]|uniref:hypothetical protein n=1 Tax=Alkalicoccus chagannorensis TaxID=427072 RepID=UPI0004066792|nr:hypothetical protein [Alkalicoccus chagannorensis]